MALDQPVSLSGKLSIEADKAPAIIVDRMTEFILEEEQTANPALKPTEAEKPREERVPDREKRLWLNVSSLDEADREELLETLTYYKGETEVIFVVDGKKMRCSEKVTPNKALMAELSSFLSENCIKIV